MVKPKSPHTRFEKARIIGARALQISMGAPLYVTEDELRDNFSDELVQLYGVNDAKERVVLDLHIENLIDSHNGMSNSAILKIQMTHFKSFLNKSINKKQRKIVVIHGVGEGVLRHEIRKELDIYHPYFEYCDASYEDFGYGATEIRLIKKITN